jgi:hypothetical protein
VTLCRKNIVVDAVDHKERQWTSEQSCVQVVCGYMIEKWYSEWTPSHYHLLQLNLSDTWFDTIDLQRGAKSLVLRSDH